jgi:hypothetical protein
VTAHVCGAITYGYPTHYHDISDES